MAPAQKAHIRMLYDISSPFSCQAFHILFRYKDVWNLEIELVPIFLGGIMVGTKNKPPSTLKHLIPYLGFDQIRIAERMQVDTRSPPGHPMNTTSLNQIRFLRAVAVEEGQETLAKVTQLIYHEFYAVQTPYTAPEFWDCLLPVLGPAKLKHLLAASQSTLHKEGLKKDIVWAINECGMYGAPWLIAKRPSDGQQDFFFGADRIEHMGWFLGPEYIWKGPYPDGRRSTGIFAPGEGPEERDSRVVPQSARL